MTNQSEKLEVTACVDDESASLLGDLLSRLSDVVIPVCFNGSPTGAVNDLARQFDAELMDDTRQMLVDRPRQICILASREGLPRDLAREALAAGSLILAIEPISATYAETTSLGRIGRKGADATKGAGVAVPGSLAVLPAFRSSPGWQKSAEASDTLGNIRLMQVTSFGTEKQCSTFARLFDAWRTALQVVEMPESIDASLVGPLTKVPREPRGLIGSLVIHARLFGGGVLSMLVSSRMPAHQRSVLLLGETGTLEVSDASYRLHDPQGELMDEAGEASLPEELDVDYVGLIENQMRDLIARDLQLPPEQMVSESLEQQVLACCEACLLSARTRHGEDPQSLMEMMKTV